MPPEFFGKWETEWELKVEFPLLIKFTFIIINAQSTVCEVHTLLLSDFGYHMRSSRYDT